MLCPHRDEFPMFCNIRLDAHAYNKSVNQPNNRLNVRHYGAMRTFKIIICDVQNHIIIAKRKREAVNNKKKKWMNIIIDGNSFERQSGKRKSRECRTLKMYVYLYRYIYIAPQSYSR